jgi:peptidyl-prolyl cis-trans isomerase C
MMQKSWAQSIRAGALVLAVSTAALLAACGNGGEKQSGATLATVNGSPIKESRLNEQLAQIPAEMMKGHEAEVKRQLLDRLVEQELISQESKRMKVEGSADYQRQLHMLTQQLKANFVVAMKVSETLTPQTLQQAYDAKKAQLAFPAVKAKHILVPTKEEADNIIKIANASNFSELAKKYSKGPSAGQGGDLGWFRREAMIPEFASVAFSTPVGSVAETPVKTQFGWHVILVEDRSDRYTPPLEQIEPQLRQELGQQVVQGYLTDLRKNATVTYADQNLAPQAPAAAAPAEAK